MINKDGKFIKALSRATKKGDVQWSTVSQRTFAEPGEDVERAYYIQESNSYLIVYKASRIVTDPYTGEDIEQVNMHLVVTDDLTGKAEFRLSDYELDESADLWTLYKTIQRVESKVDSLMDNIIKKYGGS